MRKLLVAFVLLLFPLAQGSVAAQGTAPTGDPVAGKALWDGNTTSCKNCHGAAGEGGFGPDLAGRKLSYARFLHAVRTPWGVMPRFLPTQTGYTDKGIADIVAYFDSLPAPAEPGKWRFEVPADAEPGQVTAVATIGCGQCHTPEMDTPRHGAGEVNGDFEWFKRMVYTHTTEQPAQWTALGTQTAAGRPVRMGDYSPKRLPEATLHEIYDYMKDEGFLLPITARLSAGVEAANGVTYTLTVDNPVIPGKGLPAEDVTISLILPKEATVVSATGAGYQKTHHDDKANAEVAVWKVAKLAPKDPQTYTITLSKAGTGSDNLHGSLSWAKPTVKHAADNVVNIVPAGRGRGAGPAAGPTAGGVPAGGANGAGGL